MKDAITNCPLCTGILPGSVEMEKAVLSCMMQAPAVITAAAEILNARDFHSQECGHLFTIVLSRSAEGLPVDPVAITRDIHSQGMLAACGGPSFVSECYLASPDAGHVRHYAGQVKEASRRREVVRIAHKLAAAGVGHGEASEWSSTKEWLDGVSEISCELERLMSERASSPVVSYTHVIQSYREKLDFGTLQEKDEPVPTGISGLDEALDGGIRREYIIVPAKSGDGKSLLVYQMVGALARSRRKGLAVGLEMTNEQVLQRDLSREAVVPLAQVMGRKELTGAELKKIGVSLDEMQRNCHFDMIDRPGTSWRTVVAHARDLHRRGKLDWLAVDYIQLLEVKRENGERRDEVLGRISQEFAALQKDLNITLITPSQLARDGLLAESKAIMDPCQLTIRIEMNEDIEKEGPLDEGHLHIVKNRFGAKNVRVPVTREGVFQRFVDRFVLSTPEGTKRKRRNDFLQ